MVLKIWLIRHPIVKKYNCFFPSLKDWWINLLRKNLPSLFRRCICEVQKPQFPRKLVRDSIASGCSWKSTNMPFLAVITSKPIWWSHFCAVSTEISQGNPGSNVEFGRRDLFTHLQNLIEVRFGLPLTATLALSYSEAFLFRSSLPHSTPVLRYWPWLLSENEPLCISCSLGPSAIWELLHGAYVTTVPITPIWSRGKPRLQLICCQFQEKYIPSVARNTTHYLL